MKSHKNHTIPGSICTILLTGVFLLAAALALPARGAEWELMDSGTEETLYDVWGTSCDNVYAVGWDGTILHYNGSTWQIVAAFPGKHLQSLWGSSGSDIWAVGPYSSIVHYNGSDWEEIQIPSDQHFHDVWGTGPDNVWAVGESIAYTGYKQNRGIIWHWDGEQWSLAGYFNAGAETEFDAIWGRGTDEIYVVGHMASAPGIVYNYDGTEWQRFTDWPDDLVSSYWDLWGIGEHLFAAGHRSGSLGVALYYNGSTWGELACGSGSLSRVRGTSLDSVYMVGHGGMILHFDGSSFSEMDSGTSDSLLGVWVSETEAAFAVSFR